MNDVNQVIQANLYSESIIIVSKVIYSIACIFIGAFICYLGYKLFSKGIFNEAGEVSAKYDKYQVTISRAAPGTFFILLGSIIIIWSISNSPDFKRTNQYNAGQTQTQPQLDSIPPKLPINPPK